MVHEHCNSEWSNNDVMTGLSLRCVSVQGYLPALTAACLPPVPSMLTQSTHLVVAMTIRKGNQFLSFVRVNTNPLSVQRLLTVRRG